jgi:AcrR family transcriptional regulator
VSTFRRARSEEQREIRRQAILETAATMLAEMPVSEITLNELSRRVGLAKSNVMRYFESREAVLLDLLNQLLRDVVNEVVALLPEVVDPGANVRDRVTAIAATLAAAFARHAMFCELLSAQAGVLEHNVSPETVARYKRGGYATLAEFTAVIRQVLPEYNERQAEEAGRTIMVLVGAYWTLSHPPKAVRDAYALDPTLMFLPSQFQGALERAITVALLGIFAARFDPATT